MKVHYAGSRGFSANKGHQHVARFPAPVIFELERKYGREDLLDMIDRHDSRIEDWVLTHRRQDRRAAKPVDITLVRD